MTMNLVLQGPQASSDTLDRLSLLAQGARVVRLGDHALRCEDVPFSAELKERIDAAAF